MASASQSRAAKMIPVACIPILSCGQAGRPDTEDTNDQSEGKHAAGQFSLVHVMDNVKEALHRIGLRHHAVEVERAAFVEADDHRDVVLRAGAAGSAADDAAVD